MTSFRTIVTIIVICVIAKLGAVGCAVKDCLTLEIYTKVKIEKTWHVTEEVEEQEVQDEEEEVKEGDADPGDTLSPGAELDYDMSAPFILQR